MNSIPFSIRGGLLEGFLDLDGIVRLEGPDLVVEFRTTRRRFARSLRSEPKEIRVPLSEIEEVTFKKFLVLGFLEIRARHLNTFSAMPHCDGGQLRVLCRRAHWGAARELASRFSMSALAEDLKAMVAAKLPPSQAVPAAPAAQGGAERPSVRAD
jgi:hypothetical protein